MYLKTLYIQGFKSFAQKTKIEFNNRVTGIVGPNGSGKSNITDAIMWVLGESSVKNLRGNKMEDVIFSGTDKKKPLGLCEVTIVFDNSDSSLPVNYKEVSITRKMYRSLESEYLINNTKCRLKDIKELFMDTGIGKDGYSLIGQGKIDSILSNKPEHRRNVFEEAAGISKYKMKKNNSENKLRKTEENLIRLNDIILEIESRENSLKKDSIKAKEYLSLFEELKNKDITLGYLDINKINEKLEIKNKEALDLENNIKDYTENSIEIKQIIKEKEDLLAELDKKIEDIQEVQNEHNKLIERKLSEIELNNEKNKNNDLNIIAYKNNSEELTSSISEKKKEILNINLNLEENIKAIKVSNKKIIELEKNIDAKNFNIRDIENELKIEDEKYVDFHKRKADYESKIQMCNSLISENEKRKENLFRNLNLLYENNKEINDNILDVKSRTEISKSEINNLNQEISRCKESLDTTKLKKAEIENKLSKIKFNLDNAQTKYKVIKNISDNYEGYNRSVKTFMNKVQKDSIFLESLIGPVGEHIKVDKIYEKAVSIALGSNSQNIIVKSEAVVPKMIKILTEFKMGRITFLPLDSISYKLPNIAKDIENIDGFIGFANEIVKYDNYLDNIFKNILGRIIIAKDFKSGTLISKKLKKTFRVVTLDGDSINIGGSITGGSITKNSTDILSRKNELDDLQIDIKNISNEYEKLNSEYININSEYDHLDALISSNSDKLNELNKTLSHLQNSYDNLINSKKNNDSYIDRYESDIKDIEISIVSNNDFIKKYESGLKGIDINLDNEYLNETRLNLKNIKIDLDSYKEELTNEKINKNNFDIKNNVLLSDIKRLDREIKYNEDKINEYFIKIKKLSEEMDNIDEFIKINNDDLKKLQDIENNYADKLGDLKNKKSILGEEIKIHRRNYDNIYTDMLDFNKKLGILLNEIEKIEFNKIKIIDRLLQEYEVSEDNIKILTDISSLSDLKSRTKELKSRIKEIGNVNILSIEEYESVKERLEFNLKQRDDLNSSKEEIKNIIQTLDKEMNEKFNKTFIKIQKYFDEIFKILFNGGKAEIEIDGDNNLESGIEIKAQPPGKRFQSLSLLSGGERSLTDVALLFALLKVRPAPFCILDEIDAALDDANIKRYADYLMTLNDIQFIMITHRKITMEIANALYGVTMEEKGVSKIISVELN